MKLFGDDLHDALAGQGDEVGSQIQQNPQCNQKHTDAKINKPHTVDPRRMEGHQSGIGKEQISQPVGKIGEITKEGGADQLQNTPELEVLTQQDKLKGDIQREDDDPVPMDSLVKISLST